MASCDNPEDLAKILSQLLIKQSFSPNWIEEKIVLIGKAKAGNPAEGYSPICTLSIIKFYERMIKVRLESELKGKAVLFDRHFGFVKGKSTTRAIKAVTHKVNDSRGKWFVMVTLHIKKHLHCILE